MKRKHWGEFEDDENEKSEFKRENFILSCNKPKLSQVNAAAKKIFQNQLDKLKEIKLKNPLVTQTVEVMNQTEMLQILIDTYASKAGCNNYVLNPCQVIPQVNFPLENATPLLRDDKFIKPFWFIPPIETKFSKGTPKCYPKINNEISRHAIRKSICGLLRIAGFNDASHSSLVMFTDAVDEYLKTFLTQIKDIQINNGKEKETEIDILTLEKSYQSLTCDSLITVHNYFKNDIINKNRVEIEEFKDVYQEYDKLMKESQNMQKAAFKDDDYMNFLDFTNPMTATTSGTISNGVQTNDGNVNIMNLLDGDNQNSSTFREIFEGDIIETPAQDEQISFSGGPPSLEQ